MATDDEDESETAKLGVIMLLEMSLHFTSPNMRFGRN